MSKPRRLAHAQTPEIADLDVIQCGFCEGTGYDPFMVMSERSRCQVCGGKGSVTIKEPYLSCAFCGGTGAHRDQRLTCVVCRGKGAVTVKEPAETCPRCHGKAVPPGDYLPCTLCRGTGVVAVTQRASQTMKSEVEQ
ncbi:MAG: hypothetical protein ACE5Q6_20990 [Dehalococcoidia bacterium]